MAWTGQTFTVGQILTANQMNNLQGDISALANADSGAPDIGPAIAAANAGHGVENSDLYTGLNSINGDLASSTLQTITMDSYSFHPDFDAEGVFTDWQIGPRTQESDPYTPAANGDTPRFKIYHTAGGNRMYDIEWRFVTT